MSRARPRPAKKPTPAARAAPAPITSRTGLAWLAIAVVTLLAYSNSFDTALVRDSAALVQGDPRVRSVSAENLRLIATTGYWWRASAAPLYRPATTASFLVNHAVLGNDTRPTGYHVVNLLLHALNVGLVYALVRRVAGSTEVGRLAAALFAVHPIATEAVTYVAGRADLLAAASVLGALLLHVDGGRRVNPWPARVALFGVTFAGALSKENAVVVVALAALYDAVVRPRVEGEPSGWRRGLASYAVFALAFGLAFLARRAALAEAVFDLDPFVDNPLQGLSFVAARLTALQAVGRELFLLVWPRHLSCDYSYDQIPLYPWSAAADVLVAVGAATALLGLAGAAVGLRRRRPAVAFCAGFLLLSLLPTSNLVVLIGSVMAERFLYLPLAGFAALLALALHALSTRRPAATRALVLVLVGAGAARTYTRNRDWADDETLFRAARSVAPRSYRVHRALAQSLLAGTPTDARLDEGIAEAEEAVRILDARPLPPIDRSSQTLLVLATGGMAKGDRIRARSAADAEGWYQRAVAVLERAVETDRAVNERVRARRAAAGRPPSAIRDVGLARIYDVLGTLHMRLGRPDRAIEPFAYLRHLEPENADGYMLTAWAEGARGRIDEALVPTFEAWILQEPAEARANLVELYRHVDPAVRAFRTDGSLDLDVPRVRADAARACAALVREVDAARERDTTSLRARCIERYRVPPAAFEN